MTNPTIKNIYNKFIKFEVWTDEDRQEWDEYEGGFSMYYHHLDCDDKTGEKLFRIMFNEIRGSFADKKKSLMWVDEVKRLSNWKKGETIYGYAREKHLNFIVWWSREEKDIGGCSTFTIDPQGFVALSYHNNYTNEETDLIKRSLYIRPDSLYNDKIVKQNK